MDSSHECSLIGDFFFVIPLSGARVTSYEDVGPLSRGEPSFDWTAVGVLVENS